MGAKRKKDDFDKAVEAHVQLLNFLRKMLNYENFHRATRLIRRSRELRFKAIYGKAPQALDKEE